MGNPDDRDSDRPLIDAIAAGDHTALEKLYARHGLALLNHLIGQLGDRAAAEDALQNVMLAVWESAKNFRGESQVRTWLFSIARRQAWKIRGKSDDAPLHDDDIFHDSDSTFDSDQSQRVRDLTAALDHLPFEQRAALELVFYRGMTINEAAALLAMNPNTLKSRLFRARNTLRTLLKEEIHE